MRLGALAGSFTFSGTAQCLLVNFTDELKQLEVNNYCWLSVCGSGESGVSTLGMPPMRPGLLRGFVSLGEAGRIGVSPHTCTQHWLWLSWGLLYQAGLHRLCLPATTTDTHPQLRLFFIFPFYSVLFLFFLPLFFFPGATEAEWPQAAPQSLYVHTQPWLAFVTPCTRTHLAM